MNTVAGVLESGQGNQKDVGQCEIDLLHCRLALKTEAGAMSQEVGATGAGGAGRETGSLRELPEGRAALPTPRLQSSDTSDPRSCQGMNPSCLATLFCGHLSQ